GRCARAQRRDRPDSASLGRLDPASMIAVQSQPIDVARVLAAVEGPGEGGVVLFLGRVRDEARGRPVRQLDYDAYEGMALSELGELERLALAEHGAARVALVHRTGRLAGGRVG